MVDSTHQLDRGLFGGVCQRLSCLAPHAYWFNQSNYAHYCAKCAYEINEDDTHKQNAIRLFGGAMCIPAIRNDGGYRLLVSKHLKVDPSIYDRVGSVTAAIERMASRGCPDYLRIELPHEETIEILNWIKEKLTSSPDWKGDSPMVIACVISLNDTMRTVLSNYDVNMFHEAVFIYDMDMLIKRFLSLCP